MSKRRVSYFYENDVGLFSYGLGHPMKPHRMRMTHDLVSSYGMLNKMQIMRPRRASPEAMTAFHTDEYIAFLSKVTPETAEELTGHGSRFLVGEDNPAFEGVFEFCSISAGGSIGNVDDSSATRPKFSDLVQSFPQIPCPQFLSLSPHLRPYGNKDAAKQITSGACDIAINWAGGLHHAKKREASGFCYINDIVLAILELLRTYPRVLYIDIDCHHGDGVEEAFYTTDRVLTCSFHKFGEYFPGTGHVDDHGRNKGLGYAVNVPLRDGLTDETMRGVFQPVIQHILDWFKPSAVVLQCGADSLSGDKLGCFNLTMEGHASCVQYLRKSGLPLILLGGGGYTIKNVARAWAYETACALNIEDTIDRNLPWNSYFEWFGPRYRLEVAENNMEDLNPKDGYLDSIKQQVIERLRLLPFAPSVQMQSVPRESLDEHLGLEPLKRQDPIDKDDLDEKLGQQFRKIFSRRNESSSSDSDAEPEPDSLDSDHEHDSDDHPSSSRRRNRHLYPQYTKRMSLLNANHANAAFVNGHREEGDIVMNGVDVDDSSHPTGQRKFFRSGLAWDPVMKTVVVREDLGLLGKRRVGDTMERGNRVNGHIGGMEVDMDVDAVNGIGGEGEWRDGDVAISVES